MPEDMKLIDYFAATGDWGEPPDDFIFEFEEPQPPRPEAPDYSYAIVGGEPQFDKADPKYEEVKEYDLKRENWEWQNRTWILKQGIARNAAWRYANALAMLNEREKHI